MLLVTAPGGALLSRDVPLAHYRPEMFISTHSKLDSPSFSLMNSSCRSRRSVQSEVLSSAPLQRTTSHATTTMRPRYGKEYHRIDRNRLVSSDENSPQLTNTPPSRSPMSAVSRNTTTVFTFDSMPRSLATMYSNQIGSDDNSPKMLANVVHPYANVDSTPPIVLDAILGPAAITDRVNADSAMVNYSDLDLGTPAMIESAPVIKPLRNLRAHDPPTEYAQIDLVATAAASQASRMHTRDRQDALDRCSERRELMERSAALPAEMKPLSRKGSASVVSAQSQSMERRLPTLEPKRATSFMAHTSHARRHSPARPPPPPVPSQPQAS
jgi:hypothetical protein